MLPKTPTTPFLQKSDPVSGPLPRVVAIGGGTGLPNMLFDYVIYNTAAAPDGLAAEYAARGARPIVTGTFELNALERVGMRAIGVPLLSEFPAGKIRHHPDRLASAIAALAQGKLGAWRARAEVGGF